MVGEWVVEQRNLYVKTKDLGFADQFYNFWIKKSLYIYRVSQKSIPLNKKHEEFFTDSYSQGMEDNVLGKSEQPKDPTPVDKIKLNKRYSGKYSETYS